MKLMKLMKLKHAVEVFPSRTTTGRAIVWR